jgi:hypothetical protein
MHLEHWFPTPIWNSTIEFDRISVLEECYRIKNANPQGRKISNRGGWQSDELIIGDNQIFEQLLKFKNCSWRISAEDSHKKFEYIRYGGNWDTFYENLLFLKSKSNFKPI